jgi:CelD/BcsL family acetyltransferase involved in cellulose biosynthesis
VSPVAPDAKAVFMGASYHADYATLLCAPDDLPAVAQAVVQDLASAPDPGHGDQPWDVVDLRRFRDDDPALPALESAFRAVAEAHRWEVMREVEDICPVATLPADGDWDAYLAGLDKKSRHEIRRKMRRAESAGPLELRLVDPTPEAVDVFVDLHQARWGDDGLFPDSPGGDRSRRFLHRMAELEAAEGDPGQLQLGRLEAGGRLIFATVGFDDGTTCYFYNAGMDPDARELSPGVTGTAAYIRDRLAAGRSRFDFLRGDEPYKYEWGAVDEPIHRLLVSRMVNT